MLVKLLHMMYSLPSLPLFFLYLSLTCSSKFYTRFLPRFHLKEVLKLHNIICIFVSGVAFSGFFYCLIFETNTIFDCTSSEASALKIFFFLYWATKVFELLDTVFMILRKKSRQISVLHVYHHSSMLLLADYAYNISPWPCMAFPLGFNSFIHVFVYYYYYASALVSIKNQWWKMFLTQIQILQFVIDICYCAMGYMYHGFCIYSVIFSFTMLLMFSNFYANNYWKQNVSPFQLNRKNSKKNN